MHDFHEERMAMLDAHQKSMTACFGQMEACLEYEEQVSGDIKDDQNETTAGNEPAEKIELDAGTMQSAEGYKDVRSKDVAVMPVKGLKKRRRGRKLIAGRRGETKEMNRENCGSRRKLAAACRKVPRHATVVWRKKQVLRRSGLQGNFGRRKELAIAGIRRTHCAQLVLRKGRSLEETSVEEGRRKNRTKNKFERRTRKGRTLGRGQQMRQEGTYATRKRGFKEQLRFGNVRKNRWVYRATIGTKMVKQVVGTSRRLRKIRKWVLWRGRPPPKRKKEFQVEREPVM
jgi:hypothetical protein